MKPRFLKSGARFKHFGDYRDEYSYRSTEIRRAPYSIRGLAWRLARMLA